MSAAHAPDLAPASEPEAAKAVSELRTSKTRLRLVGGATKTAIGRPSQQEATLSAARLFGVTLYEPAELVVGARSGTPLAELKDLLASRRQMLPFEPPDYRALLGSTGEPTVGGLVAANASGPRRIAAGAARDNLIGVRFVNGRGEVIKSGGRVMKNVTGLDLVKLMAGSWGTLGFLTEATFKVVPMPETTATLVLAGLDDRAAIEALSLALGSPFEVTGAAHLPAALGGDGAKTFLRIEGTEVSVRYRLRELADRLTRFAAAETLEAAAGDAAWAAIRDITPLAPLEDRAVWRLCAAPSRGWKAVAELASALDVRFFYDWGGGLIWLSTPCGADAGEQLVRSAIGEVGGYATLIRAPQGVRAAVPVFTPLAEPLMRVTSEIKAALDPAGLFNPGRMYAGV